MNIVSELSKQTGVDEDSVLKVLKSVGFNQRFERSLSNLDSPASTDDLRLVVKPVRDAINA